jgi:hypothetical protein
MGQYFIILWSLYHIFQIASMRGEMGCRCTDTHNKANRRTVAPFHCECAKKRLDFMYTNVFMFCIC